jgi:hypothetical protein
MKRQCQIMSLEMTAALLLAIVFAASIYWLKPSQAERVGAMLQIGMLKSQALQVIDSRATSRLPYPTFHGLDSESDSHWQGVSFADGSRATVGFLKDESGEWRLCSFWVERDLSSGGEESVRIRMD